MSKIGNKEIMSRNLRKYIAISGKDRKELSSIWGFPYSTVTEWVNGKKYPRMDRIEIMANYFGIEMSDLIEDRDSIPSKSHRIPVFGKVAAGLPLEMVEDIIDYEEIPAKWGDPSDFFCLQIKGDSMKPRIEEGDVVVVRKQSDADTGDIVIYSVNGEAASCKRLKKTEDGLMFIPFNNEFMPKIYRWDEVESLPVQILGRVIELRGKL